MVLKGNGDIRVFSIEATVVAPSIVTTLEFSAPAKQSTMQEIPMVNSSGQDWQIRGVVQAAEPGKKTAFVGPPALNVPKGKTIMYPLTFKPMWTCEDNASLTLTNGGNGGKMEYSLLGTGMEPLAEDHVVISCQARERIQKAFAIDNKGFSGDEVGKGGVVQFRVESDLPHVSGDYILFTMQCGSLLYFIYHVVYYFIYHAVLAQYWHSGVRRIGSGADQKSPSLRRFAPERRVGARIAPRSGAPLRSGGILASRVGVA